MADYPSDEWQQDYMDSLVRDIVSWKDSYYNGDGAKADDATYDLWWKNLLFMESKYPHLVRANSPTGYVGIPIEEEAPAPRKLTMADLQARQL